MERREFLRNAALAGVALEARAASSESLSCGPLSRQRPKAVVRGKRAVAASQHPIVTETMLDVLKSGGNAVDAAMAGAITQATVQTDMTNHTGTVTFL
jgi:gamma-glutamyltranspeptidase/glutathione hydrolase